MRSHRPTNVGRNISSAKWTTPNQLLEAIDTVYDGVDLSDAGGSLIRLNWSSVADSNVSWAPDYFDYSNQSYEAGHDADDPPQQSYSSPYLMPWPQQTAWVVIFTLMLIVATLGNALVAWIVLAHRRMKTVTNYFLVNLSLTDLTMSLFNCIFNFAFMLNSHWPFGATYCTINNFIANVTVASSVFTLIAISSDRYIAIVYPLRPRMSKCIARLAIALIWVASMILAIPCLLYSQTISHRYPNGELRIVCLLIWPDGLPSVSQQDFIYNIVFMVMTYLIPVTVMAACYSRMSHVLWRSKGIGELSQRQIESIRSKRKVVRMFIVVVVLFAVCWLPYHGYFVYQYINRKFISSKYVQHIFLAFYWLAMSNAMINPVVYYWMNARFRQYFKTVICHCLCFRKSSTTSTTDNGVPPIIARSSHSPTNGRSGPECRPFVHFNASSQQHQIFHWRNNNRLKGTNGGTSGIGLHGMAAAGVAPQVVTGSARHHDGHQRCLIFNKMEPNSNSDSSIHHSAAAAVPDAGTPQPGQFAHLRTVRKPSPPPSTSAKWRSVFSPSASDNPHYVTPHVPLPAHH